ncbi:MAG: M20/M25/M40 family metallo-hydrolase [Myxococcota bacterium]
MTTPTVEAASGRVHITAEALRRRTALLADDAMEGRGTDTPGGRRAVQAIEADLRAHGIAPAGDDGSYLQAVPLTGSRVDALSLQIDGLGAPLRWQHGRDVQLGTEAPSGTHAWRGPMVFAGYGVTAPEYDWDDYANLDVRGALVLVLVGDPPVPGRFEDDALTYYGRWTYKLERARALGAAGVLIVHDERAAGYDWAVVQTSFGGERFTADDAEGPLMLRGWIAREAAAALARRHGSTLDHWRVRARLGDGLRLRSTASATVTATRRELREHNVVGRIGTGRAPAIAITAHWDHLGRRGDAIFNGALDNASGVAALLTLAEALQAEHERAPFPGTLYVVATAAEEQGLWGSRRFVAAPPAPLNTFIAAVNFDGMNVGPTTNVVELVGAGRSTLDDVFASALAQQGRRAVPDRGPSTGAAFRSDQFVFAGHDIPTLYAQPSIVDSLDPRLRDRARRYHTPEDVYEPAWSFEGAVADLQATFDVVQTVARGEVRPRLHPAKP